MITTFQVASYKLQNNKWVPHANTTEIENNGMNGTISSFAINEKTFDTEEEANKFVREYCIKMGYHEQPVEEN